IQDQRADRPEYQTNAESFYPVPQPGSEALVRQSIATLQQETGVEADLNVSKLAEQHQEADIDDHRQLWNDRTGRTEMEYDCLGGRLGERTQAQAEAGPKQTAEQRDTPQQRNHARSALQAVIAGRSVFVQARCDCELCLADTSQPASV